MLFESTLAGIRMAACVWQLYLAHFGSLIWPTPWFGPEVSVLVLNSYI